MTQQEPPDRGRQGADSPPKAPSHASHSSHSSHGSHARRPPETGSSRWARPRSSPKAASQRGLRVVALAVVLGTTIGIGIADAGTSSLGQAPANAVPVAALAPAGSQSSSWYCVGGGTTDQGHMNIVLTNVSGGAVHGLVGATDEKGGTHLSGVDIPAHGVQLVAPAAGTSASWLAARIDLDGGGVSVAQAIQGSSGWSEVPCISSTSTNWYFAAGSTSGGRSLTTELYNPASTTAVVNLTFITSSGVVQPEPYQGIVLAPGELAVRSVGTLVQNHEVVATEVTAKSGRVVASEVENDPSSASSGLSLEMPSNGPQHTWVFPATTNVPGSTVDLNLVNPTAAAEQVTVSIRLPSGPVAPITNTVAAGSVWPLMLSAQTRIPNSVDYVTTISANGGGLVAARTVQSPPTGASPRSGAFASVTTPNGDGISGSSWLLAPPGVPSSPIVSQAAVSSIAVANPATAAVSATVQMLTPSGFTDVPHGTSLSIPAGGLRVFVPSSASPTTYRVLGSSPVVVSEDLSPAGSPGVLTVPGIPTS